MQAKAPVIVGRLELVQLTGDEIEAGIVLTKGARRWVSQRRAGLPGSDRHALRDPNVTDVTERNR